MYDIQSKKPTLNMEPGVFNEDFDNFAIRLGGKADNGRDINDVLIYDHTKATTGQLTQIVANEGEMVSDAGGGMFVMKLYDGNQYVEQRNQSKQGGYPFTRTSFDTYTKVFDLSQFALERHSANLFTQNRAMLATWQLQQGVDSIDLDLLERKQTIANHVRNYLPFLTRDTTVHRPERAAPTIYQDYRGRALEDSTAIAAAEVTEIASPADLRAEIGFEDAETEKRKRERVRRQRKAENRIRAIKDKLVSNTDPWPGIMEVVDRLDPAGRERVMTRTLTAERSIVQQARSTMNLIPGVLESRVKHVYDKHMKYSMALVCIIFIFIGAPMGAIVRKGGFGYPILVSVIFFVIFIILTIFCRKLAESFVVQGAFAGWLPCLILFPVSLYITARARNDAKLFSTERLGSAVRSVGGKLSARRRAVLKRYAEHRRRAS